MPYNLTNQINKQTNSCLTLVSNESGTDITKCGCLDMKTQVCVSVVASLLIKPSNMWLFLFNKWTNYLKSKIRGCGGHWKKYNRKASYQIKKVVSEVLWPMDNSQEYVNTKY